MLTNSCVYLLTDDKTQQPQLIQKLTAATLEADANYGESVSIFSGLLAVGEPGVSEGMIVYIPFN